MSSLRFTRPLMLEGLPEEAAAEWEGLCVGLATAFGQSIGTIEAEQQRWWDESQGVWRIDEPLPHDPNTWWKEQQETYMWISHSSLLAACKHSQPERPHIRAWLESDAGSCFLYFRVPDEVAEYLP